MNLSKTRLPRNADRLAGRHPGRLLLDFTPQLCSMKITLEEKYETTYETSIRNASVQLTKDAPIRYRIRREQGTPFFRSDR